MERIALVRVENETTPLKKQDAMSNTKGANEVDDEVMLRKASLAI